MEGDSRARLYMLPGPSLGHLGVDGAATAVTTSASVT